MASAEHAAGAAFPGLEGLGFKAAGWGSWFQTSDVRPRSSFCVTWQRTAAHCQIDRSFGFSDVSKLQCRQATNELHIANSHFATYSEKASRFQAYLPWPSPR